MLANFGDRRLVERIEEAPPDREADEQRQRRRREHGTGPRLVTHGLDETDEAFAKADVDEGAESFLEMVGIGRHDVVHAWRGEGREQVDAESRSPHPEAPWHRQRGRHEPDDTGEGKADRLPGAFSSRLT